MEEKKKSNVGLIILVVILLLACAEANAHTNSHLLNDCFACLRNNNLAAGIDRNLIA